MDGHPNLPEASLKSFQPELKNRMLDPRTSHTVPLLSMARTRASASVFADTRPLKWSLGGGNT